jgi:hypothetical protein
MAESLLPKAAYRHDGGAGNDRFEKIVGPDEGVVAAVGFDRDRACIDG